MTRSTSPQYLQCFAFLSCPSLEHELQARVSTSPNFINSDETIPVGTIMRLYPSTMITTANNLPMGVEGTVSPYPVPVIVVSDQYTL